MTEDEGEAIMTVDLKQFQRLKAKVEDLRRRGDRAEGALAQLTERLKTEFDCGSVEAAEELRVDLEKRLGRAERKFARKMREFEDEWGDVLK
jgi:hypothetical protein